MIMKTYNTPAIEFAYLDNRNIIATSLEIDPSTSHDEIGAPEREDDEF